eukprot:SAG31_NODE_6_length_43291_cov_191.503496_8_plen_83_part_00
MQLGRTRTTVELCSVDAFSASASLVFSSLVAAFQSCFLFHHCDLSVILPAQDAVSSSPWRRRATGRPLGTPQACGLLGAISA